MYQPDSKASVQSSALGELDDLFERSIQSVCLLFSNIAAVYNEDPFLAAVQSGNVGKVGDLIHQKVDITKTTPNGENAYILAAATNFNMFTLIKNLEGICKDTCNRDGNNALHIAALSGQVDIFWALLSESEPKAIDVPNLSRKSARQIALENPNLVECVNAFDERNKRARPPGGPGF